MRLATCIKAATAALVMALPASAETVLKRANTAPEQSVWAKRNKIFIDAVNNSGTDLKIEFFR